MEGRIVELLEAATGIGAVVAKVNAALDASEVESTQDAYDPDGAVVRSERKTTEQSAQDTGGGASGVAGAAANQPLGTGAGASASSSGRGSTSREDEVKNYEITRTTTRQVTRTPRLKRLSVAVLLDGVDGKPRAAAEIARLAELAKSAVGFDAARGDKFEISSAPFIRAPEPEPAGLGGLLADPKMKYAVFGGGGLLLLLIIGGVVMLARGGKKKALAVKDVTLIRPGARVAELEAAFAAPQAALPPMEGQGELQNLPVTDPAVTARERARTLAAADPQRAAQLLKAWMDADSEREVA